MGTHEELDGLLMPLAKLGFRVIIPNLPGKGKMGRDATKPVFGVSEKKRDSNRYPQLQRLARKLKFRL